MQNSLGSSPFGKLRGSLCGHFEVARIPVSGQIITVTILSGGFCSFGAPAVGFGLSAESDQLSSIGVWEGSGRAPSPAKASSVEISWRFGKVPEIKYSVRTNSFGTFVT